MQLKTPTIHRAQTPEQAARELAEFVAQRLRESLALRGRALLVVSGGSTPLPFFEALSQQTMTWPQVSVTLADERWVDPSHADSNERLVRGHLLAHAAAHARFVPLKNSAQSAQAGLAEAQASLAALPWPADVTVLGVGGDGHTASLFAQAPQWPQWLADCARPQGMAPRARVAAISAPSSPNVALPRLSMTPAALLDARAVVVHATGASKWAVLQAALQEGPVAALPVRCVLAQQHVPCHIFVAP